MFEKTNWAWVRRWTGSVFGAALALGTFAFLTASPVVRPGGVMDALPTALGWSALIALVLGLIAGFLLARYSNRRGGNHDS
ncbi:MAG: hypothetical protein AAF414_15160 [Pseudomonadota bacterium]